MHTKPDCRHRAECFEPTNSQEVMSEKRIAPHTQLLLFLFAQSKSAQRDDGFAEAETAAVTAVALEPYFPAHSSPTAMAVAPWPHRTPS